jgi:hypothetical protein
MIIHFTSEDERVGNAILFFVIVFYPSASLQLINFESGNHMIVLA